MIHRLFRRVCRVPVRRPLIVSAILVAAAGAAAALALRIQHDFSPRGLFADSGLLSEAQKAKQTFGQQDATLLVLLEATGEKDVLDPAALTWQATVADHLSGLDTVEQVRGIPTIEEEQVRLGLPPERIRVRIVEGTAADEEAETRAREFFERNALAKGGLISEDYEVAAMAVSFDAGEKGLDATRAAVAEVEGVLAEVPLPEGYRRHLSGLPVMRVDIVDNLQADQMNLIPIAGVIYLVVLALVFRRVTASVMLLGTVGLGLLWTLATMVVAGESFNLVSNVLPMLLMILGVSNGIHFISRYGEEAAKGQTRRQAAYRSLVHIGAACLLTFVCSTIGFASMWTAQSAALRSFASQATMGMACLYVSLLLTLGTLLPLIRPPRVAVGEEDEEGAIDRALHAVSQAVMRRPLVAFAGTGVLLVSALLASRHIVINSYTIETYDEGHPTLRTMRLVEEKLGGLLPLDIVLTTEERGALLDPETVRRVVEVEEFAKSQPEVGSATSYASLHRGVDDRMGELTEGEAWPPAGEEGRARLERSESFLRRMSDEVGYAAYLTADGAQARLSLRVADVGTRRILDLVERLDGELAAAFPRGAGVKASITGDAYVNARAMDSMIRDLFGSLATASVTIFGVMAVMFRSLRLGVISAIPNLTPLLVTLGYMGLRGYDMNAGNVIVFTISLGIAVDDTIHFLHRFREERRGARSTEEAVRAAMRGAGRPMVLMGLLIVCGLAVLLLSDFVPTRRFAELTIVTMAAAPLGDLVLLPACLVLFSKRPADASETDAEIAPEPDRELLPALEGAMPLNGAV